MHLSVKIVKQYDGVNKEKIGLVNERIALFCKEKVKTVVCPSCGNTGNFIANIETTLADSMDYGDNAARICSFVCDPCGTIFQPKEIRNKYVSLYRGNVRGELPAWRPEHN